jgi:DNA-binding NarL/FixJ family response regulator
MKDIQFATICALPMQADILLKVIDKYDGYKGVTFQTSEDELFKLNKNLLESIQVIVVYEEERTSGSYDIVKNIALKLPFVKVVILTGKLELSYIENLINMGVDSIVDFHCEVECIAEAIKISAMDGFYFSKKVSELLSNEKIEELKRN